MTRSRMAPALLFLAVSLGACDGDLLDVKPVDEISEDIAIVDARSAQAALVGAYSALQGGSYYGGAYVMWSETLTDNVEHTGTFDSYADADLVFLRPDMGGITGMWTVLYDGINRVNLLIQKVPAITSIDAADADAILGQAYALRALHYFNLVRAWGDVPLVLAPPATLDEAALVSRSTTAQVYTQIASDLGQAASLLSGLDNSSRTFVTPGFVTALQARIALYQGDWAGAVARARALQATGEYSLAGSYGQLFTAGGDPTSEDIFRVAFTATDYNNLGYYYQYDGRFEIGATQEAYDLFDPADDRFAVNFNGVRSDGIQVVKFPTTIGGEDLHVIRYADVLLILAEALAEQDGAANLSEAVDQINAIRARSGMAGYVYGVDLTTQQEVLDAVFLERRMELAFEGEYWFDLVRTGRAATAIGANFDAHEALWPIPVSELDVAPNLTQNPGY
ncbi:MAG: RagB/SusD family nutrient uptake outer membrane protein [Gemmatimonadota bacterium]|nr:RagB/SusD family nutrient uptake outer membrane protein [Gemmatimonadota bacterium]MDH5759283.1 RagB/SusD family nutrient uptake outer membrane protein [Gemmatimonadota bacterium]